MEYLLEGINRQNLKKKCELFIEKNKEIIEDVFLNNYPILSPINDKIIVSLDKKLKGDFIKKIVIDVSQKQIKFILLQINFMRMKFNDFVEYLIKNKETFIKADLKPFSNGIKNHKLEIGITNGNENGNFFMSENSYEYNEASKIFLHSENYDIYEKQLSFIYGKELDKSIRNFFRLKFLKFYLYKNYSLKQQANILLSGSFLLFAMGFRTSRDTDIYSLQEINGKMMSKYELWCDFNINQIKIFDSDYKDWKDIFNNPKKFIYLFGFKTNNLEIEIKKRYGRIIRLDSRKALADFLVLKYYLGEKTKIDLSQKMPVDRLIQFRYKYFNRQAIKKYFDNK